MPNEALRVEHANVVFDGFKALDIDRFVVFEHDMRIVIGPNGAGKTTLCDVISGKTRLKTGQVFLDGEEVGDLPECERARRGVGRKFQTPSVFGSLTVLENMELAARSTAGIADAAESVGLASSLHVQAQYLSHGQRQALEIGMLVVAGAWLMLLDEPAAGLSDQETAAMVRLQRDLAGTRTLIVIEHDMDFVRALGAGITVLNEGKILAEGPMHVIQADPRVIEAYLGR
jgi:urea transport system ATP-binding protein